MKTLLTKGVIHGTSHDTLLISGNRIEKIGKFSDFNCDEINEIIDCEDKYIMPGFNDSHMHLIGTGLFLSNLQLQECKSVDEVMEAVKQDLIHKKQGEWVIGRGWNQDNFCKNVYPTRSMLDAITTSHPICLTRCCGHIAVCNSKAIELSGLTQETSIEGGEFDLDSGLFKEMALEYIHHAYPKTGKKELKKYIEIGIKACHENGITSVQSDDFVTLTKDYTLPLEVFRELDAQGECNLRIHEQCQFIQSSDLEKFVGENHLQKEKSSNFTLGPIKVVGDGSLGARTAKMSSTYCDDTNVTGILNYTQEDFDYYVKRGKELGMGTIIHAIGDGCLDQVLSSFENFGDTNNPTRSGIVHAQITRVDQLVKIAKLKLHAYIQSCFIDYDSSIVESRVGEKANTSYAFKTLKETTTSSNGSDSPVEPLHCFKGIECAVTRSPINEGKSYRIEEALSLSEAIDSYTKDGAYASLEESIKGQLLEGMLADIIVVNQNPYQIEANQLHSIAILRTIFDGKTVYCKAV